MPSALVQGPVEAEGEEDAEYVKASRRGDRAAPDPRFRSVADTRVPAATPRARSTRPCPLGRSPARAGRSVLSLFLPPPATRQSPASPTAAQPLIGSCFPSPGNPARP